MRTFYDILTAAVDDIAVHGFDSADRVARWVELLRAAARDELIPEHRMVEMLEARFRGVYRRMVDKGELLRFHKGADKSVLLRVRPRLNDELSRRVAASAALIRLNREEMVERTVRRFTGWASSVPAGGSDVASRRETKKEVRKPLASLPFEERRVMIDQGHKFLASLSAIVATDGGALAGEWHSNFRQAGYNARPDHEDRDHGKSGRVYLVRNSWAHQGGLVKPGPEGYTDDVTQPGEEVFCRCQWVWLYRVSTLPERLITERGRKWMERKAA